MESRSGSERFALLDPDERAGVRILVAEDEDTLRKTCVSVLRGDGYDVTAAAEGDAALQLIRSRDFDIVMLDLYIAEVPGVELLRAVMERRPETFVIVTTGNPSVESSLEVLAAGARDYLPKPFSAIQLEVLLGRAAYQVVRQRDSERGLSIDLPAALLERPLHEAREAVLRRFERAYLEALLDRAHGEASAVAAAAGMEVPALERLLEAHDLQRLALLRPEP